MGDEETLRGIPGGNAFLEWFGGVPTFHDAEIAELDLRRDSPGKLVLHTAKLGRLKADGYFAPDKACQVTILLTDVFDVHLRGFGRQNVVGGILISRRDFSDAETSTLPSRVGAPGYVIEIAPCHGLSGFIHCLELSIEFVPKRKSD